MTCRPPMPNRRAFRLAAAIEVEWKVHIMGMAPTMEKPK